MKMKSDNAQLSVVVPKPLKSWVQQQARGESINAAAWVRRLILAEKARRVA